MGGASDPAVKTIMTARFESVVLALEGLEILSMAYEQEESWDVVSGLMERIFVSFVIVQIVLGALIPLVVKPPQADPRSETPQLEVRATLTSHGRGSR